MTACFTLVSAANCLPAWCFWIGQKAMEISGPHAANWGGAWLRRCGWEVTDSSFCCPSLAPSDVHLFGSLTKHLVGKRFAADISLLQAVASCLQSFDADFFYASIQALGPQWDKCLNTNDGYVKVWRVPSAAHLAVLQRSQKKKTFRHHYLVYSNSFVL
jgi:hypothetical protein